MISVRTVARSAQALRVGLTLLATCAAVAHADPPPEGHSAKRVASVVPARGSGVPSYGAMVRKWHTPPSAAAPLSERGLPLLVLEMVNTSERVELTPLAEDGGFSATDIQRASYALRDPRTDDDHPIDPRVLDIAYRVQCHFGARTVRIVSAFRLPHGRSKHGRGRALDLVIPGTSDQEVARFVRTMGFVGVGLYTQSGFVHVDSRPRSYFWVDSSGPGQRARRRAVLSELAARSDDKALAEGESPPSDGDDGDEERAAPVTTQLTTRAR